MERFDLAAEDQELLQEAIATSDRLYLEGIHEVAASLRTAGGKVFSAIHIESRVGWADVCGEVAAVSCMVAAGHRDLETIVAVWRDAQGRHFILPPCGRCREIISDFNPEAWVIVSAGPDHWQVDAIENPCRVRVSDLPTPSNRFHAGLTRSVKPGRLERWKACMT